MAPRRRATAAALAAVLSILVLTAGCGPDDPYSEGNAARERTEQRPPRAQQPPPRPADPAQQPPADGELAGTVPQELRDPEPTRFPGAGSTPRATLRRAATLYGNWTSATAPEAFRKIAAISVGDARAQLRQVAAQSAIDAQQEGVRSRSELTSLRLAGRGGQRSATIVTRDTVTGPGLPDTGPQYHVTRAQLVQRSGRWVIARWEPQP